MENSTFDFKEQFKALQVIFFAMLLGQLIFVGVTYYLNTQMGNMLGTIEPYFMRFIGLMGVIISVLISRMANKIRVAKNMKIKQEEEKFIFYRASKLIEFAIIESGTIINIILGMLTANTQYLLFALALIVFFGYSFPSISKYENELN